MCCYPQGKTESAVWIHPICFKNDNTLQRNISEFKCSKISLTICWISSKLIQRNKKTQSLLNKKTLNREDPWDVPNVEISKDFKAAISMLKGKYDCNEWKDRKSQQTHRNWILEIKYLKLKTHWAGRTKMTEERISEPEIRSVKIIQCEEQKEVKVHESLVSPCTPTPRFKGRSPL